MDNEMNTLGEMEVLVDKPNRKVYRTSCGCHSGDHVVTLDFENDNGLKSMSFEYKSSLKGYYIPRGYLGVDTWSEWAIEYMRFLYETAKFRIKTALKALFFGYIELDADLMFRDSKQILAMVEAMINVVKADHQPQPDDN